MKSFSNILRGITGEFEITRSLGALGVLTFIIGANGFEAYTVIWKGSPFDITAYCLAFPSGLAGAITAIGLTAGSKDKSVASAQVIRDTNALPGQPQP